MYKITTYSGAVHLFDTERRRHLRQSERSLGIRSDAAWSNYWSARVLILNSGDAIIHVLYTNGEWLYTSRIMSAEHDGEKISCSSIELDEIVFEGKEV